MWEKIVRSFISFILSFRCVVPFRNREKQCGKCAYIFVNNNSRPILNYAAMQMFYIY